MRVAHLLKSVSRSGGGVATAVAGLTKAQASYCNFDQAVFAIENIKTEEDSEMWGIVPVYTFRGWPPHFFSYSPDLLSALCHFSPDVIHLHGLWSYTSIAAQEAAKKTGAKVVISVHGMLNPWAVGHKKIRKSIAANVYERGNLRKSACLHALTQIEAEHINNFCTCAPVFVIPNGIERPPKSVSKLKTSNRTLLFVGRIHPIKGIEELLRGWAAYKSKISEDHICWNLSIIGSGETKFVDRMRELSFQLGISSSVAFEGPRYGGELWQSYESANAFILCSRSEAMPMAVLEAWASGLPVVMTPESGLTEGIEIGAALPVSIKGEGVGQAIFEITNRTDQQRTVMGMVGADLVKREFGWSASVNLIEGMYNYALGKQR